MRSPAEELSYRTVVLNVVLSINYKNVPCSATLLFRIFGSSKSYWNEDPENFGAVEWLTTARDGDV